MTKLSNPLPSGGFVGQQTRQDQDRYTLCAAYQLVRDDLRKRVNAGSDTVVDAGRLHAALSAVNTRLEALVRKPGE